MPEMNLSNTEDKPLQDQIWDMLVLLFGEPAPTRRALYGRVTKYLTEQEATPALIRERASRIAMDWGPHTLTITSLEKHWSRFDGLAGQLTREDAARGLKELESEQKREWVRSQIEGQQ